MRRGLSIQSLRQLRDPTINHNNVIISEANPFLDGSEEPFIKALLVLLIGHAQRPFTLGNLVLSLVRQNICLTAVPVPVLSELIDSTKNPRENMVVKAMLIVEVD